MAAWDAVEQLDPIPYLKQRLILIEM